MRHPLRFTLGRAGVAVAGGVLLLLLVTGAVAPATGALATAAPPPPRADGSVPAAPQSARPTASAFVMTMSDADLTKAAAASFPQTVSGVTVSDPDVRVDSGGVRLTARAKVLFGTTEFVLRAIPSASDGRLAVRVDSATLAGVSLPDSTRVTITETLQSTIARLVPADARVIAVTLAAGRLSVTGTQP